MHGKNSKSCPVCERRRNKRSCPAKGARICSVCCGREREVSINCPLDCLYLRESRDREYKSTLDPSNFPFKEIEIDQHFIEEHGELLNGLAQSTLESTFAVTGASDIDTQLALEALIECYRTLKSGIYYERRPDSSYGRAIFDGLRGWIQTLQRNETERTGFKRTRDEDIMAILIFLYRMALDRDNGKPQGKAFLDFLQRHFRVSEEVNHPLIIPSH